MMDERHNNYFFVSTSKPSPHLMKKWRRRALITRRWPVIRSRFAANYADAFDLSDVVEGGDE